ncbi:MAG: hypothetical protein GY762_08370 [Proteobacteria bacterium]|nr:hypothetical protein [Pseudomonadota bacterium]
MKKSPTILFLAGVMVASCLLVGCRDENDPDYWLDQMHKRAWREKSLKTLNEIFNKTMQENNSDLSSPAVQQVIDRMVPKLIDGFKAFKRDKFNRTEIIKLLAQMKDERAAEVFMAGLSLEEISDSMMFQVSANALGRLRFEQAIPVLIRAHEKIVASRASRDASFTVAENEIEQAIISATSVIVVKKPDTAYKGQIVQILCHIAETSDERQELRLNMKALKGLGRIGSSEAIPTLIKGIAMKGKRQPIALGQIAFTALQQIHDRDAVVDAIIAFGTRKDESFNTYYQQEIATDPVMQNPNWYLQQATTFVGDLNYPADKVIDFLTAELNHTEPDASDNAAADLMLRINFPPNGWAMMRRNWAAVALAKLAYTQLADVIADRMGSGSKPEAEEAVGYVQAMGYLQLPDKSCNILLKTARSGDDSIRDKAYFNASLMCGSKVAKAIKRSHDKINCKRIVKRRFPRGATDEEKKQTLTECDIMKKRLMNYKSVIDYGDGCGGDMDCLIKAVDAKVDPNKERAIYSLYRIARDDETKRARVVDVLSKNLNNPNKGAMRASVFALDRLTPQGNEQLVKRIQQVYKEIQLTYKAEARMLEAFIGRVRNRAR